jgi:hypothetical protein
MKKIFVLFSFLSLVSFAVNAQTCPHAKKGASSASTEVNSDYAKTVAAAAEMDNTVEAKVCEKSGHVSYSRKVMNEGSAEATYTPVEYNASTKKFVNVSPSDVKKMDCCAGSASKKSCSKAEMKSCSKSKASSSTAAPSSDAKVKMIKSED